MKESLLNLINNLDKTGDSVIKRELIQLKKEVDKLLSCQENKDFIKNRVVEELKNKDKIQIGGGQRYLDDFINIDVFCPADIICDVRNGIPFPSNSTSFIFNEHFLEHIDYPNSVLTFFNEAFRVLKLNGKLVVGVPDVRRVICAYFKKDKRFLKKIKDDWYSKRVIAKDIDLGIDMVNLIIRDEDASEKYNPHFWGYDEEKIRSLFKQAGFKGVKKWKFNNKIANPKRKFCSIYIEGMKG